MDKSKKASSKKSKTVSSSQSASKGRDVTDCSNVRDKAVLQAAAATPSTVETTNDRQEIEVELNQLRQENRDLQELKRRHEAELSALRRSNAEVTTFLNSLREVSQGSGGTGKWFDIILVFVCSFSS